MRIRQFTMADYSTTYAFWASMERGIGLGPSDRPEEIAKKLARDPDLFLLAEDEGRIVGTVIGGYDGRRGLIYHLAVAKGYRRQGLGSRLMAEVESRLKAKGCYKCYMVVHKDNESAISYYKRRGWSDMTTDVILMGKVLCDDDDNH
jgi:ribosomal protein S18 acetylase RimI-like enzyme